MLFPSNGKHSWVPTFRRLVVLGPLRTEAWRADKHNFWGRLPLPPLTPPYLKIDLNPPLPTRADKYFSKLPMDWGYGLSAQFDRSH